MVSNSVTNHHTRRLSTMPLNYAGSQIVFTAIAAFILGTVKAGIIRKLYILPLSTPVTVFTCPLQTEVFVVSGQ